MTVRLNCAQCSSPFEVSPYKAAPNKKTTAKYCSRACQREASKRGQAAIICASCGAGFSVIPARQATARYCGRACHSKAMTKPESLNQNPNRFRAYRTAKSKTPAYLEAHRTWKERNRQRMRIYHFRYVYGPLADIHALLHETKIEIKNRSTGP